MTLNLCPEISGEEKMWRFLGIWMKNRWEWTASLLACMHFKITAVGFYDAMSAEQVDFILNQTEMKTLVVTQDYAVKIINDPFGSEYLLLENRQPIGFDQECFQKHILVQCYRCALQ